MTAASLSLASDNGAVVSSPSPEVSRRATVHGDCCCNGTVLLGVTGQPKGDRHDETRCITAGPPTAARPAVVVTVVEDSPHRDAGVDENATVGLVCDSASATNSTKIGTDRTERNADERVMPMLVSLLIVAVDMTGMSVSWLLMSAMQAVRSEANDGTLTTTTQTSPSYQP